VALLTEAGGGQAAAEGDRLGRALAQAIVPSAAGRAGPPPGAARSRLR
jgi:hypothetical protein